MAAVLDVAVVVVNSLAHAMHNDGAVDDLGDGADAKKRANVSTKDPKQWEMDSRVGKLT
jgi:hypothetical protein